MREVERKLRRHTESSKSFDWFHCLQVYVVCKALFRVSRRVLISAFSPLDKEKA